MAAEPIRHAEHPLKLDAEERSELLALLRRTLGETRVEVHHTHTPEYRDGVLRQEAVIRRLIEKIEGHHA